ncbi:MAG: hypothetical protein DMF16_05725 [Verrucomicrobia bacterium]|nr:MAG: hypothetical protein DMF16_05725 [Verrucomicrobiota bacterium]
METGSMSKKHHAEQFLMNLPLPPEQLPKEPIVEPFKITLRPTIKAGPMLRLNRAEDRATKSLAQPMR